MTPLEEHERNNNRIFWLAVAGIVALVVVVSIARRDTEKAALREHATDNQRACSDRAMSREYHRGRSPSDEDIEGIVVSCMNAHPKPR